MLRSPTARSLLAPVAVLALAAAGCADDPSGPDPRDSNPTPAALVIPGATTVTVYPTDIRDECQTPSVPNACYLEYPTGWLFYDDETDQGDPSLGSIVSGPDTPSTGSGSVQVAVSGSQRRNLATYQFAGTALADITALGYSTYNPSAGNGGSATRAGYLQFNIDFDGSDTWQRRIGYLPSDNGTVLQDTWQDWDAIDGGGALWFYSGATWPGTATPGSTARTWSDIVASYPDARIRLTDAFLGIRVGEPYADGYTENIDALVFGTAAGTTIFDFETDEAGPLTTNVAGAPNPAALGTAVGLSATVDDAATGGSTIVGAEYSVDGGPWAVMTSVDGAFDEVSEEVTATLTPAGAGLFDICVRGTDAAGTTGDAECTQLVVYDPDGGFVTGGGWFDSPMGALAAGWSAQGGDLQTFDVDPVLASSQAAGTWYVDRFAPAGFESAEFDGDARLRVTIDGVDLQSNSFYNYQGRKYDLDGGVGTTLQGDLYIPSDWEGHDRHASMWATMGDAGGTVTAYPIVGVTVREDGSEVFRVWNGEEWEDLSLPVAFDRWYHFQIELTASSIRFHIDGDPVFEGFWASTSTSTQFLNVILQAYNFGETYEVHWDDVGLTDAAAGRASFGFNSKYRKGASEPDGSTVFSFEAGGLKFHSSDYDWLVVNQSGENAQFKGTGTIDGHAGEYRFMLWAGDHDSGDTFRIRIWSDAGGTDVVVYDNGMDQPIGGGNIIVHDGRKK